MRKFINVSLIVILVMFISVGCSLMDTSIEDRIDYFIVELNLSRTNIIDHFHPDAANYNNLDANYFDTGYLKPDFGPHSVDGINVSGSTATGTLHYNDTGTPMTREIVFGMRDDGGSAGEDWKIYSITVDGDPQF